MIRLRLCFALKGHDPPSNRALPEAALKGGKSILVGPSAPGTIAAKSDGTEAFPPLQAAGPRSSRRPVCGTPALAFLCNPRPAPDPRLHRQPINSHPSANSQRENQRRIFPGVEQCNMPQGGCCVIQIFQERFLGRPDIVVRTQSGYLETSWETRPDSTAEESRRIRVHEKLQFLHSRALGGFESCRWTDGPAAELPSPS